MDIKQFTKLSNYDYDELFPNKDQILNSHATVHY
jgi:hypothetical protein